MATVTCLIPSSDGYSGEQESARGQTDKFSGQYYCQGGRGAEEEGEEGGEEGGREGEGEWTGWKRCDNYHQYNVTSAYSVCVGKSLVVGLVQTT